MESPALGVWSVSHWTTKEVPPLLFSAPLPVPVGAKHGIKQMYTNQLLDLITRGHQEDLPRGLMQGMWVQSLVGELRSHMPLSQKNKRQNQRGNKLKKDFKNGLLFKAKFPHTF